MVWSPKNPPLPAATYYVRLPTTCYSLLPIYYLLPITTYYYLLPTTNYYLPHTTPPHRGRGDWTMLLLLGYHDHGWRGGGWDPEPGTYIHSICLPILPSYQTHPGPSATSGSAGCSAPIPVGKTPPAPKHRPPPADEEMRRMRINWKIYGRCGYKSHHTTYQQNKNSGTLFQMKILNDTYIYIYIHMLL